MEFDDAQIEAYMEMQEDILWSKGFANSWRHEPSYIKQFYENQRINEAIAKAQDRTFIQLTEEELNIPF